MSKKILVVDADRPMLLRLRNELGQHRQKFTALLTENGRAAAEAVRAQGVALLVVGDKMELEGEPLPVQLFKRGVLTPVILLVEPGQELQAAAWSSCVVRTMVRPIEPEDLAAAVLQALANEALEGLLHGVSASSFFQFVEVEGKTCTITISRGGNGDSGQLFFSAGRLLDARFGDERGVAAALKVLAWEKVDLAILNFCPLRDNRINRSIGNLLLDAAVAQDHAAAAEKGIDLGTIPEQKAPPAVAPAPAPAPVARKPLLSVMQQAFPGNREGVDSVAADSSWDDLLVLARTLGKDLELPGLTLCAFSGLKEAADLVLVPATPPIALHVNRFANRDLVVDKVLRLLDQA